VHFLLNFYAKPPKNTAKAFRSNSYKRDYPPKTRPQRVSAPLLMRFWEGHGISWDAPWDFMGKTVVTFQIAITPSPPTESTDLF
jgi:hypothetical protein